MEGLKRTPLYEEHLALGARMVPFAGWEMPVQYSGIIEEHEAVRESAGVFDVCHMAQLRVCGDDALAFLQHIFTNDLSRISELGTAQYTLMLDDEGGIIDDLIVYHTGDTEYLVIANASNHEIDFEWLSAHSTSCVELADESDRTGLIALQGPMALEVLSELAGAGFSAPDRFRIAEALIDSIPVLVARTGYTGEDGVELVCKTCDAVPLWRAILSFSEVTPVGLGARDTLRLEMGYPLHGSDIDRTTDPISARLGWVCPKDKTGYIGEERVARARAEGTPTRLAYLVVSDGVPRHGYPVLHEGREVGKVASGTFSPSLRTGIATAYLPVEFSDPGVRLEVAIRKRSSLARTVKAPFVKTTSIAG